MKRIILIVIAITFALTSVAGLSNELYKVFRQGKPLIIDKDRAIINGKLQTGRTSELSATDLAEDLMRNAQQATVRVAARDALGSSIFSNGSGVNIDSAGMVVTAAHVVQDAANVTVTFFNGRRVGATIEAIAPEKDLAVLRLIGQSSSLPFIALGDSLGVRIGDKVTVIGFPLGDFAVNPGTVSKLNVYSNTGKYTIPLMQVNAHTNKGNSGGPVIDSYGRVIGIVVGTFVPVDDSQKNFLGAVVPINEVKPYL